MPSRRAQRRNRVAEEQAAQGFEQGMLALVFDADPDPGPDPTAAIAVAAVELDGSPETASTPTPGGVDTGPGATVAPMVPVVVRRRLPAAGWAGPLAAGRRSLAALETLARLDGHGGNANANGDEAGGPYAGPLSDADWETLAGWGGWGPMAPALEPYQREPGWKQIGDRLRWLLPDAALDEARQATPNAFYTSPDVAAVLWRLAVGLGFPGGAVLEPGCGAGVFMSEAPDGVSTPIQLTGVERDPTTARIAGLLWPDARIIAGPLERTALRPGGFALAIGNVPFSDVSPYDPAAPDGLSLHNYFLWRSLQAVHAGGLVVAVTSRYTLDAENSRQRRELAADADLVGAIRLPSGAFAAQGTDVTADILVLRRRPANAAPGDVRWMDADDRPELRTAVNEYFNANPDQVIGRMEASGGAYGHTLAGRFDGADLPGAIVEAADRVIRDGGRIGAGLCWQPPAGPKAAADGVTLADADGRKEGSFHVIDGDIQQVQDGHLAPVTRAGAELRALIILRDTALELLDAEADHDRPDAALEPLRERLNRAYDVYRAKFGPLNRCSIIDGPEDPETGLPTRSRRRPQMGGFRHDPDYVTVLALEEYDDETGQARKAEILRRRVNRRVQRATSAAGPAEALALCLDEYGRVDLPTIARLLEIGDDQAAALALGDLVYQDPAEDRWMPADEYLSGDVRVKLNAARTADQAEPSGGWARNVAALERVQPAELGPAEIKVKLGAPWVTAADVELFLRETIGGWPQVSHEPLTATWEVKIGRYDAERPAAIADWGTGRVHAYRLAELALNGGAPTVYDEIGVGQDKRRVRNMAETMMAENKQRELNARFAEWVWEDPDRTDRLTEIYNRQYNSTVVRRFNGEHLTFPGLVDGFDLYPHQRDIVYRIASTPAALCGHPVGAGKTASMFASAMTLRRLGLATKPAIVVPNHLLEQIARDGKRLYPSARILMVTKEDMSKERRKLFAARCATGDWDAVVLTHSAFTALAVDPATEAKWLSELIDRYHTALLAMEDDRSRIVKQLAKKLDRMRENMRELLDHRTDDGVTFEQLGVDFLHVDEAHYFKNLGVFTRMEGFSMASSKRAADLSMKLWWLRRRNPGGRSGALFTGTPVSNSLAELYVLQSYLQPDLLDAKGFKAFDGWAGMFVEFVTAVEVAPDGGSFRLHRRPGRFVNVPELWAMFGQVADIRDKKTLGLHGPDLDARNIVVPPSPELEQYVMSLVERADAIRSGTVDPEKDNMLSVCVAGRRAALDLELVNIRTDDPGKVGAVVNEVARLRRATRHFEYGGSDQAGALQIVFCDQGTPRKDASQTYGKIRAGLVNAGIPVEQIRFIHDAKTDGAKAQLFADCRAGLVSVLLGSTDKLGVGTNIQTRCVGLHHVDAPWRPADIEQREGRQDRPGNKNAVAYVFRYVTERSFDSYMWQTLQRKATFIGQFLAGGLGGAREIEDLGDNVLSFAEVKALATGQPLLMELAEVQADVARLRSLATGHTRTLNRMKQDAARLHERARAADEHAGALETINAEAGDDAALTLMDGTRLDDRTEIGKALGEAATVALEHGTRKHAGRWRGLGVYVHAERAWGGVEVGLEVRSRGYKTVTFKGLGGWVESGQAWRLTDALARGVDTAASEAAKLRETAGRLRVEAADAERWIGRPFEQADELAAAKRRMAAIEAELHAAAAPAEPAQQETGPADADLVLAGV